jgi:glutaminase
MLRLPRDPTRHLQDLLERLRPLRDGELQGYLPELTAAEADRFAIAVATVDGEVFAVGDAEHPLGLQSMSKPFIYGLALDRFGREEVHRKVGVEPTGEAFNSITELEEDHLPYNPMINSGAIAMSAMLHHAQPEDAIAQIMAMFSRYLGRAASVPPAMPDAPLKGSHRNLAIAHLLRHFEVIGDDIDGALELYAHQCAVTASTTELALMAATLANGGVHPRTGERAVQGEFLRDILTLMFTCGMYDSSGAWAYTVGVPAKSGVSGGILAVVPGRMGVAVYSPRLDRHGHSVRGVQVFRALSAQWNLSLFDASPQRLHLPEPGSPKA